MYNFYLWETRVNIEINSNLVIWNFIVYSYSRVNCKILGNGGHKVGILKCQEKT